MIKSLIIGSTSEVEKYSRLIQRSKYFKSVDSLTFDDNKSFSEEVNTIEGYDAILLVSHLKNPFLFLTDCIKAGNNLYFTDQVDLTSDEIENIALLYDEAGSLIFPELKELHHPLIGEFIATEPGQLYFKYIRSIAGKREIRQALLTALAFLSLLSSMPVKKIDVSTIETTSFGRPAIKVRLKMYDSSVCNIVLDIDNKADHSVNIESAKGNFHFNLAENYLENIHGTKFYAEEVNDEILLERSLNSFALNIILNTRPVYSFRHYLSVISLFNKIENILKSSF